MELVPWKKNNTFALAFQVQKIMFDGEIDDSIELLIHSFHALMCDWILSHLLLYRLCLPSWDLYVSKLSAYSINGVVPGQCAGNFKMKTSSNDFVWILNLIQITHRLLFHFAVKLAYENGTNLSVTKSTVGVHGKSMVHSELSLWRRKQTQRFD